VFDQAMEPRHVAISLDGEPTLYLTCPNSSRPSTTATSPPSSSRTAPAPRCSVTAIHATVRQRRRPRTPHLRSGRRRDGRGRLGETPRDDGRPRGQRRDPDGAPDDARQGREHAQSGLVRRLYQQADPDFIELKAYMHVGHSRATRSLRDARARGGHRVRRGRTGVHARIRRGHGSAGPASPLLSQTSDTWVPKLRKDSEFWERDRSPATEGRLLALCPAVQPARRVAGGPELTRRSRYEAICGPDFPFRFGSGPEAAVPPSVPPSARTFNSRLSQRQQVTLRSFIGEVGPRTRRSRLSATTRRAPRVDARRDVRGPADRRRADSKPMTSPTRRRQWPRRSRQMDTAVLLEDGRPIAASSMLELPTRCSRSTRSIRYWHAWHRRNRVPRRSGGPPRTRNSASRLSARNKEKPAVDRLAIHRTAGRKAGGGTLRSAFQRASTTRSGPPRSTPNWRRRTSRRTSTASMPVRRSTWILTVRHTGTDTEYQGRLVRRLRTGSSAAHVTVRGKPAIGIALSRNRATHLGRVLDWRPDTGRSDQRLYRRRTCNNVQTTMSGPGSTTRVANCGRRL